MQILHLFHLFINCLVHLVKDFLLIFVLSFYQIFKGSFQMLFKTFDHIFHWIMEHFYMTFKILLFRNDLFYLLFNKVNLLDFFLNIKLFRWVHNWISIKYIFIKILFIIETLDVGYLFKSISGRASKGICINAIK